jgi:hypothetical protein
VANDQETRNVVEAGNWQACYNSGDNEIVLSCKVRTLDAKPTITGAGPVLVNRAGQPLSSFYSEFDGSATVELALNLPPSGVKVGDFVMGVASGEAAGQHYLEEQKLQVTKC